MSLLHAVGWALVHFVWQGMAIAAVLAIALAAARRAPATFRYGLCAAALMLMIAVPAATVLRLHDGTAAHARAATPSAYDRGPGEPVDATPAPAAVRTTGQVAPGGAATRGPDATIASRLHALRLALEPHLHWLVAFWILGVFLLSVRLLGGFLRARQLTRQGTRDVPDAWRETSRRLARQLGVTTGVRVLQSALVMVPVVIGWLRPVILLPGSVFTGLTPHQLEAILAHELAHIRRHDYLVNLVQAAIETVLFYHPAVWWVGRRLRAEREHCCDDLAVAACGDARGYASALVDMERLRGAALAFALGAGGGGVGAGSLVARVRRLLAPPYARSETAPRWAAGAVAVVAALAIGGVSGVPAAVAQRTDVSAEPRSVLPQAPDTVVRHPDPAAALADRWAWAHRQARSVASTGYWVGYTIAPPASLEHKIYIDRQSVVLGDGISMSGRMFGDFEGLRFPGRSIAPLVGGDGVSAGSIKLLFEYRGTGQLARIHASTFALPVDLGGRPLLWLGSATDQQSLGVVQPLYAAAPTVEMKEQVIDAIGVHSTSALVVPLLERYVAANEPTAVRAQAVEWLGWHPVQPALALLARLARSDRSGEVRREAAEAIGEMHLPAATDTLIDLVRTLPDIEARREAVEGLGHQNDARARAALDAVAREDRHSDVQREAVETLGEMGTEDAHRAVLAIARSHTNSEVRREAIETLSEGWPTDETVEELARIAREDPNVDVQREAVEALGEIGDGLGLGAVVQLAMTHPHSDVRREAVETVGEYATTAEALGVLRDVIRRDPSSDVRREAIETLGEIGDTKEAVAILKAILNEDPSIDIQEEALDTLMELSGGAGIAAVIEAARSHKNPEIRQAALRLLAESDDPRARAIFERALGNP